MTTTVKFTFIKIFFLKLSRLCLYLQKMVVKKFLLGSVCNCLIGQRVLKCRKSFCLEMERSHLFCLGEGKNPNLMCFYHLKIWVFFLRKKSEMSEIMICLNIFVFEFTGMGRDYLRKQFFWYSTLLCFMTDLGFKNEL